MGPWQSADIVGKPFTSNQSGEFKLPDHLYEGRVFPKTNQYYRKIYVPLLDLMPLSKEKY